MRLRRNTWAARTVAAVIMSALPSCPTSIRAEMQSSATLVKPATWSGLSFVVLILLSVSLGALLPSHPAVMIVPALAVGFVLLVSSPTFRLAFVVVGGMLTLSSSTSLVESDQILTPKTLYLIGVTLAFGVALFRRPAFRDIEAYGPVRPVMRASLLLAAYLGWEMIRAISLGTDSLFVLRDAASYLLFAAIPIFALDAVNSRVSRRWITGLFVITSMIATVSYALQWISARNVSSPDVTHLTLAGALPGALVSFAFAGALMARHYRLLWAAWLALIIAMVAVTGNRSTIVFLLSPIVIVMLHRRQRLRRFGRLAIVSAVLLASAVTLVPHVASILGVDTARLSGRFASLTNVSSLTQDQSVRIRLAVSQAAEDTMHVYPVFGAGPGHVFPWTSPLTGITHADSFTPDSPLIYPAKFGYAGVGVLVLLIFALGRFMASANREPSIERSALIGFAVAGLAWALLISPVIENKGFVLGFMLLFTLALYPPSRPPSDRGKAETLNDIESG